MFRIRKTYALLSILFCLSIILYVLSGCSMKNIIFSDETAQTIESKEDNEPLDQNQVQITMTYYGSEIANAQQVEKTFDEIIMIYAKKTKIFVTFNFMTTDSVRSWMITQYAAGIIPEIIETKRVWAWEDYTKGLIHNLTQYLEAESSYCPTVKWKDVFSPAIFQQTIDPANNVSACVPFQVVTGKIIYNKQLFARAGIDEEPKTWQEYINACKLLKEAGIVPFGFANSKMSDNDFHWLLSSIFGQLDESLRKKMDVDGDGQIIKNEQVRATDLGLIDFSKTPFIEGFELVKELSKYFDDDFNSIDRKTNMDKWLRGEVAMITLGSWEVIAIESMEDRGFEYGVLSSPLITKDTNIYASGKLTVIGGSPVDSFSISKRTQGEKLSVAVDFLQFLTSAEIQEKLAKDLYYIPVFKDADSPEIIKRFMVQENEDILRSNYTGAATSQEFSDFLSRMGQLYLADKINFSIFSSELNVEWKKAMDNAKVTNNWSEDNNYGMLIRNNG